MADSNTPNPDPNATPSSPQLSEFSEKIESALREGGRQIRFDDIEKRYRGKRVWVLDREKMQQGVMRVVDEAIRISQQAEEGAVRTRQRVAQAIATLFGNSRNITSPVDPDKVAARPARPATPVATSDQESNEALEDQITRLASMISQAESVLTKISTAAGRVGSEGRGSSRRIPAYQRNREHDVVLAEIFKTNLELRRGMAATPSEN